MKRKSIPMAVGVLLSALIVVQCTAADDSRFQQRRAALVREVTRMGVGDPKVLRALNKVERHKFVPEDRRDYAYHNYPLPIGQQQTISQPYIVAYMTEALKLSPDDTVLEIGTGSGYQAAVLAELVRKVYSIEIIASLGRKAEETLKRLGYRNVAVKIGDGYLGWPEYAPFDAIIITAAPPRIPEPLIKQLKDGGRMILPLGTASQELILLTKKGTEIIKRKLLPVRFVPMTGKVQQPPEK